MGDPMKIEITEEMRRRPLRWELVDWIMDGAELVAGRIGWRWLERTFWRLRWTLWLAEAEEVDRARDLA